MLQRVVIARAVSAGPRGTIDLASAVTLTFEGQLGLTIPSGTFDRL